MKRKYAAFFFLLALASCSKEAEVVPEELTETVTEEQTEMSAPLIGNVLLDDDLTALAEEDPEYLRQQLGAIEVERLFPYAGEFEERTRREGLHKWYRIRYDNSVMTKTKALEIAGNIPGVEEFEFPMPIKMQSLPFNDPSLSRQWHYINNGGSDAVAGVDINVAPVWKNYTTGSSDVIVGVVDGGVDYSHPDLEGVVIREDSRSFNSYAFAPHDHGTHVAGTIAAINNNGKGVSGIAGGDAAAGIQGSRIISCQIFAYDSEGESVGGGDSGSAIKWAADHGAVIVNNSWGYVYKTAADAKKGNIGGSDKAAVDYFNKYAGLDADGNQVGPMAGGLVVFAAGNEGWEDAWPAKYEGVMAVGSFDAMGGRAYYSNYGDWVDIAAPGGSARNLRVYSTMPGASYGYMQGTSMACPHVSGVAALIVAQCGGPGFTREMLWERLTEGANKNLIPSSLQIGPAVDALGAVTYGDQSVPVVPNTVTLSAESNRITVQTTLSAASDGSDIPVYGYLVLYGTDRKKVEAATPSKTDGVEKKTIKNSGEVGDEISVLLDDLSFEKEYFVKLYAYSYSLVYSESSEIVSVTTEKNNPPVVTLTEDGPFVLRPFDAKRLWVTASDPDGHDVRIEYQTGSAAEAIVQLPDNRYQLTITAANAEPGEYAGMVIATDKYGAKTEVPVKYTIRPNTPPVLVKPIANVSLGKAGSEQAIDLTEYFADEDGEQLKYVTESSAPSSIHASTRGNVMYLYAMAEGTSVVTVKAMDAKGESVSCSFKVVSCDPDVALSLYPNPSDKYINIRTAEEGDYDVSITSRNGAVVYTAKAHISLFEPLNVDLSGFSAGTYTATLKSQTHSYKQTFVKR